MEQQIEAKIKIIFKCKGFNGKECPRCGCKKGLSVKMDSELYELVCADCGKTLIMFKERGKK